MWCLENSSLEWDKAEQLQKALKFSLSDITVRQEGSQSSTAHLPALQLGNKLMDCGLKGQTDWEEWMCVSQTWALCRVWSGRVHSSAAGGVAHCHQTGENGISLKFRPCQLKRRRKHSRKDCWTWSHWNTQTFRLDLRKRKFLPWFSAQHSLQKVAYCGTYQFCYC